MTPNLIQRLDACLEHALLKNGQVTISNQEESWIAQEGDKRLAKWAKEGCKVSINDDPRGCRVLSLVGREEPENVVLFGPEFGKAPTALVNLRLAYPSSLQPAYYSNNERFMPRVWECTEILVKAILLGGRFGKETCGRSFGHLLNMAGIGLQNSREAKLVKQIALLGSFAVNRLDPTEIYRDNKFSRNLGRTF